MSGISTDIAVIGGGVIGLTIALRLRADGREVVVIEPNTPGSGASYGNAGTIADYAIIPVGTPSVLRDLPSLLLDANSPLAIRKSALPSSVPLARALRLRIPAAPLSRTMPGEIADLLSDASSAWTELAAEIGASNLLTAKGCLYLYQTSKAFQAATSDIELRRSYGVSQELLSADDVLRLEPRLPRFEGGGLFFPKALNITDPGEVMLLLSAAVRRTGVDFLKASATCIARERDGVRVAASPFEVRARTVVIAAGAHSRKLAAEIGDPVPLDTERGYHVEYDMAESAHRTTRLPRDRGLLSVPDARATARCGNG